MARILVAEDDPSIRKLVRFSCEKLGHEVSEVVDAPGAIQSYEHQRPDLVILDMKMPGGGGEAVLKALQASSPACPVLVITGALEGSAARVKAQSQVDQVLSKPFRISDIVAAVEKLLKPKA